VPILVTADGEIIDGHAIFEACKALGYKSVSTIIVDDLTEAEIKALRVIGDVHHHPPSVGPFAIA
jgi:ParB-like chromosome segregation protein Spo0J